MILLPGVGKDAAMATTMEVCQRLRDSRFLDSRGLSLSVSGSFGLATFPEDGNSVHAILRSADKMMYEVKATSRNNVAVAGTRPGDDAAANRASRHQSPEDGLTRSTRDRYEFCGALDRSSAWVPA